MLDGAISACILLQIFARECRAFTSLGISLMAGTTFQTNPIDLNKLLEDCRDGVIQLPDFQRSWVWDEDRIKSLVASISRAFPIGALMSLDTGGPVNFKPRPVEGGPIKQRRPRHNLYCLMVSNA